MTQKDPNAPITLFTLSKKIKLYFSGKDTMPKLLLTQSLFIRPISLISPIGLIVAKQKNNPYKHNKSEAEPRFCYMYSK